MPLPPDEERVGNSDKFYGMQKISLMHQETIKGSEDNQIDITP